MILEKMLAAELEDLRAEVEATISSKVAERREELQSQLSELLAISGSADGTRRGPSRKRSVVAMYRNPAMIQNEAVVVYKNGLVAVAGTQTSLF